MWQRPQDSKPPGDRSDIGNVLARLNSESEKKDDVAKVALDYVKKVYEEKTGRPLDPATVTIEDLEKLFP